MAAVQQGMKSLGFPGTKPNPYRERSTVNLHYQLAKYMGTGEPQELSRHNDVVRHVRTDPDARGHRHRCAAGEVRARAGQAPAPRGRDAVPGTEGRLRGVLQRSIRTRPSPRATRSPRTSRWRCSAGLSRACWRAHTSRRPASTTCTSSRWAATSVASGTGTGSPASSATTTPTATSRCSRSSTSSRRRSSPTAPRSSSIAATSASISGSTTARCSPRRCATVRWDEYIKRWRMSTNRGDDIRARFVVMTQGSYNRPKLPGIPGIKDFKRGHVFHSARWDYDYTGGDANGGLRQAGGQARRARRHRRHRCAAGPAPRPRRPAALRVSADAVVGGRCAATRRPIRTWAASLQPGWQEERKRNFHRWSPLRGSGLRRSRIRSATSGRSSAAT